MLQQESMGMYGEAGKLGYIFVCTQHQQAARLQRFFTWRRTLSCMLLFLQEEGSRMLQSALR